MLQATVNLPSPTPGEAAEIPFTYHVVSHTHWDREWYQPFQEFRVRLVRLVDRLLDLLGSDSEFRYFMLDGQSVVLDDYLAIRPDREADLRRHISSGRILVGPWYVLPDEFLVSPESLIRNLLQGARICSRFGAAMPVGYIPDTFGHVSQLPQIFRGFGLDSAVIWRGLPPLPTEFTWQAPDGSQVLAVNLREGYGDLAWAPGDPDGFTAAVRVAAGKLRPHAATANLLLTDGSDHLEARPDLPALLAAANGQLSAGPEAARLVHSTLPRYIAAVRAASPRLETVCGEFRSSQRSNILPGVLSARMWIKQRNRSVETLLSRWAEPFSAIAGILEPSPSNAVQPRSRQGLLSEAWRLLLQNQPHDSICGCSVDQVHDEMRPRFDQAEQIAQAVTEQSLVAITGRIDTSTGGGEASIPVVVFNSGTASAAGVVAVEAQVPPSWSGFDLRDDAGRQVPFQVTGREEVPFSALGIDEAEVINRLACGLEAAERIAGQSLLSLTFEEEQEKEGLTVSAVLCGHSLGDPSAIAATATEIQWRLSQQPEVRPRMQISIVPRTSLSFVARDVPGCGYATYFVRPAAPVGTDRDTAADGQQLAPAASLTMENDTFRLTVDAGDGTLSITDKRTGAAYRGLNRFVDDGDRGDEYNFCPVEGGAVVDRPSQPPLIRLVEDAPERQTVEIALLYRLPAGLDATRLGRCDGLVDIPIVTRVSLTAGISRVDLVTTVTNAARDHRLRVAFPTPVRASAWRTETPFDVVERPVTSPGFEADPAYREWHERPVAQQPQQEFCDISGPGAGLMLANRGLPEAEAQKTGAGGEATLILTLLRCVGWLSRDDLTVRRGHAGPGLPTPEAQCQGRHTFHYSLLPHAGDWMEAAPLARAFAAPLRAVTGSAHPGSLPPRHSFVTVEPPQVSISALKTAEHGNGLALRLWNASAEPVTATVRVSLPFALAHAANLKEDAGPVIPPAPDSSLPVPLRPHQTATILLRARPEP